MYIYSKKVLVWSFDWCLFSTKKSKIVRNKNVSPLHYYFSWSCFFRKTPGVISTTPIINNILKLKFSQLTTCRHINIAHTEWLRRRRCSHKFDSIPNFRWIPQSRTEPEQGLEPEWLYGEVHRYEYVWPLAVIWRHFPAVFSFCYQQRKLFS